MKAETFARYLLALLVVVSGLYAWVRMPRPRFQRAVAWVTVAWIVVGWMLFVPLAVYLYVGGAP